LDERPQPSISVIIGYVLRDRLYERFEIKAEPFRYGWSHVSMVSMRMMLAVGLMFAALLPGQEKRLTFEVASIRPTKPGGRGGGMRVMPGGQEFVTEGVSLRFMIGFMYWVPTRQVMGGPAWLDSDQWDIAAKADRPHDLEDLREMFRNMLADEFKLKLRKDVRDGPVYALMVDKSGLKMKLNEAPWDFEVSVKPGPGGVTIGKRVSIQRLCYQLEQILQRDERPVIDRTGLPGYYDFTLAFLPELPPGFNKDNLPEAMPERPSIFDALKQQLGLKLEAQKGPVDYFVIDHVEKPAEN
jgi:uncharacterized protein (TIGR03435 family)